MFHQQMETAAPGYTLCMSIFADDIYLRDINQYCGCACGCAGRPALVEYWNQVLTNNSFTALLYPIQNTETL